MSQAAPASAGDTLARNLDLVRERVVRAAARSGRPADQVRIMAVTKTHPREVAQLALDAGITLIGENRVQEAAAKWVDSPAAGELHLIGHLQRNKAKTAAGLFHTVQSVDKIETAVELHRHCVAALRPCRVLLEVNTSGEPTKSGVGSREDLLGLLSQVLALPGVQVQGLMTVGPLTADEPSIRRAFRELRDHRDACRTRHPELGMDILSMGMSGDYEIAVEEGSTMIRLGTALFGPRGT